ncbi:MAG: hypothetical protein RLZZ43_370, partial [Actinomycetota bacterium]
EESKRPASGIELPGSLSTNPLRSAGDDGDTCVRAAHLNDTEEGLARSTRITHT